jgi:CRP/FNR family cyclic AMP-dependent transcriptional regulator
VLGNFNLCHCKNPRRLGDPKGIEMSMLVQSGIDTPGAAVCAADGGQAESVAEAVVKRRFKRGEVIVEQGEKSNTLFIILTGRVRVVTSDKRGREVILATLAARRLHRRDEPDRQRAAFGHLPRRSPDRHAGAGPSEFARCLPENSSMAYAIMKGLVQRLRQADRKIESLALMDVYGRVARALLEFAKPDRDGEMTIRDKISRQDIAKMVGASREMVSRVMKDLEDRGFIETAGRRLHAGQGPADHAGLSLPPSVGPAAGWRAVAALSLRGCHDLLAQYPEHLAATLPGAPRGAPALPMKLPWCWAGGAGVLAAGAGQPLGAGRSLVHLGRRWRRCATGAGAWVPGWPT